jgi:hypothetical protein
MAGLRLSLIACPSVQPELEMLAAASGTVVSFCPLEMGLHEKNAAALHMALQEAVDAATDCDGVALGYGLCNRGVEGVAARAVPLAIPRAHDCIAMLLGSARRYLGELQAEPGTYFQSAGWLAAAKAVRQPDFTFGPASNVTAEKLAARYGKEAAQYLMEQFESFTRHYRRLAYIATPVEGAAALEAEAEALAGKQGWRFERLEGDLGWLKRLLNGEWHDDEFLVLQPGQRVVLTADERLMAAETV